MKESKSQRNELDSLLSSLQKRFNHGYDLNVTWEPNEDSEVEGLAKDGVIHLYSNDIQNAKDCLVHEFLEVVVHGAVEPYRKIVNIQRLVMNSALAQLEKEAYREREKVIESLRKGLER